MNVGAQRPIGAELITGADAVLRTAAAAGIDICFANPGTTELPLVEAFDRCAEIRPVLGVFEGVCTGAADGYARISGRAAMALLHLGPGLANGLSNLHNALRARSPVVTLVGEHATWHRRSNAPLLSDIASLARPMSTFVHTSEAADTIYADVADTVSRALQLPGGPVTLILPADVQWSPIPSSAITVTRPASAPPDAKEVQAAAAALHSAKSAAIMLGGNAMRKRGLEAAERVARATGCDVLSPTFPAVQDRGVGLISPRRIPYPTETARKSLSTYELIVLAGGDEPVAFFGYPEGTSRLLPDNCKVLALCSAKVDPTEAVTALADALGASQQTAAPFMERCTVPSGPLTATKMCETLAAVQPENAIVMDESVTAGFSYYELSAGAPSFTYMTLVGGSIGHGLPCAIGAAAAAPRNRVICLEGDGSALYTIQSLWTMARERQNITTVICKNRAYEILRWEIERSGAKPGRASLELTGLDRPDIDFVKLANGFGVDARSVNTVEDLDEALRHSFQTAGPMLIEATLQ